MELWDRMLTLFQIKRGSDRRYFELNESLHTALVERADREKRPAEEIQAELLEAGLAHLQTSDGLKARWATLSQREREMTAFACLGYTNRQMAARLLISPETVKTHLRNAMAKFDLHSKAELHQALSDWDFSEWEKPQR